MSSIYIYIYTHTHIHKHIRLTSYAMPVSGLLLYTEYFALETIISYFKHHTFIQHFIHRYIEQ